MRFKKRFDEFMEILHDRMEQGYKEYGDESFEKPLIDLLEELEQEVLDQAGWGFILYDKIQRLKKLVNKIDSEKEKLELEE